MALIEAKKARKITEEGTAFERWKHQRKVAKAFVEGLHNANIKAGDAIKTSAKSGSYKTTIEVSEVILRESPTVAGFIFSVHPLELHKKGELHNVFTKIVENLILDLQEAGYSVDSEKMKGRFDNFHGLEYWYKIHIDWEGGL